MARFLYFGITRFRFGGWGLAAGGRREAKPTRARRKGRARQGGQGRSKGRRPEGRATEGSRNQERTRPTRSTAGGANAPKRAALRPPESPPPRSAQAGPEGAGPREDPAFFAPRRRTRRSATRARPAHAARPQDRGKGGVSRRRRSGRRPLPRVTRVCYTTGGRALKPTARGRPARGPGSPRERPVDAYGG